MTLLSLLYTVSRLGVPPMPSSPAMRAVILRELERHDRDKPIVDLGSGWGGLATATARRFPDRWVAGYELALLPLLFSKLRLRFPGAPRNLAFARRDIRRLDPEEGTIYLAYLSPRAMETIRRRFEAALPRETLLISALFAVRSWRPARTHRAEDIHKTPIFVYEIRTLPGGGSASRD